METHFHVPRKKTEIGIFQLYLQLRHLTINNFINPRELEATGKTVQG
jgi:hypothetical protein